MYCGSKSTLWRHQKRCQYSDNIPEGNDHLSNTLDIIKTKDQIISLLVSNLSGQNKELVSLVKSSIISPHQTTNNTFNTINNTFNLHLFLNETCKDAMNISEFIDTIEPKLADLENLGEVGYVKGITNIILSGLSALDVNKRPIHCTDKKRETLYIKDNGEWIKEAEDKPNVKRMIVRAEYKCQKLLPQYKQKYPNYSDPSSPQSDHFNRTIVEAMGGAGNNEIEKTYKIVSNIAKCVAVDKTKLLE